MKIPYRERLQLPDWYLKRCLQAWIFEGRCPTCGEAWESPELHHNSEEAYLAMPDERPEHLIPLCPVCHAVFEWARKARAGLLAGAGAVAYRAGYLRVRLEDVDDFYRQHVRDLHATLDEVEEKANLLRAMSEAGREWEQRRAG